jgi:hypothetical protein
VLSAHKRLFRHAGDRVRDFSMERQRTILRGASLLCRRASFFAAPAPAAAFHGLSARSVQGAQGGQRHTRPGAAAQR